MVDLKADDIKAAALEEQQPRANLRFFEKQLRTIC